MQLYPAVIIKDETNRPTNCPADDYVRVRIPAFHGTQTSKPYSDAGISDSLNIARNDELPWACLSRGLDNKDFSAQQLQEGDIVFVGLENEDISRPIILGFGSRHTYTEDPDEANNNLLYGGVQGGAYGGDYGNGVYGYEDFEGANEVVRIALREAQLGEHESPDGSNKCKYTKAYGTHTAWCAIFCWWVFREAKMSQYYYGGNKCNYTPTLKDYYVGKNQFITSGFKAGDLIFMNWRDGKRDWPTPQHVGIAVKDQVGDTIETVEGNTSGSGSQYNGGMVMRKTRKLGTSSGGGPVCGGVRLGLPITTAPATGDNESQVYKFLKLTMGYNDAQCCGIMANIYCECLFKTSNFTKEVGDTGGSTSYGICMWNSSGLYQELRKQRPNDYNTLSGQLLFLKSQLEVGNNKFKPEVFKAFPNTAEGACQAGHYFAQNYERCSRYSRSVVANPVPYPVEKSADGKKYFEWDYRGKMAQYKYWPKYGNL